jgi:hypothetical protein
MTAASRNVVWLRVLFGKYARNPPLAPTLPVRALKRYPPFGIIEGNDVILQEGIADVEFPRPPVAASALSPKDDFR